MKNNNLALLEQAINYKFKNTSLLIEALSHPSLNSNLNHENKRVSDYERLEFLGDTVLNLVISELLYYKYPTYDEGMLAKLRSSLVCKEQIFEIAKKISLFDYIIMTQGEEKSGGRININNLENSMEALIAAIYLDSGIKEAKSFINKLWKEALENPNANFTDPKSELQEWVQARKLPPPIYEVIEKSGSSHSPTFKVQLKAANHSTIGIGKSKKAAEKIAATELLNIISKI